MLAEHLQEFHHFVSVDQFNSNYSFTFLELSLDISMIIFIIFIITNCFLNWVADIRSGCFAK